MHLRSCFSFFPLFFFRSLYFCQISLTRLKDFSRYSEEYKENIAKGNTIRSMYDLLGFLYEGNEFKSDIFYLFIYLFFRILDLIENDVNLK